MAFDLLGHEGKLILQLQQCPVEVSDDLFSFLFLSRLVSIAALLGHYSPSHHSRLTLCSGRSGTLLLSLGSRLCSAKVVNFTRQYLGGRSRLLGAQ
jgi:hypothetical protein